MTTLQLPAKMAKLRNELDGIVAQIERAAAYGAVLLSAQQGLRISVDTKEERISEQSPTLGTVLTAFDGQTMQEQAIGGFDPDVVSRAARELIQGGSFTHGQPIDPGPARSGDFVTAMRIAPEALSTAEKVDRCRTLQQRVQQRDPRIVNARVIYNEASEIKVFRNRAADLAQRVQRVSVYVRSLWPTNRVYVTILPAKVRLVAGKRLSGAMTTSKRLLTMRWRCLAPSGSSPASTRSSRHRG